MIGDDWGRLLGDWGWLGVIGDDWGWLHVLVKPKGKPLTRL